MVIAAGILVTLVAIVGVALTLLTLPGIWVAVAAAVLAQWWHMERYDGTLMYSWWVIGVVIGLAVLGEVVEMFASAAGAAGAGGTKRGAIGSVVGGLVGAILGTVLLPIPIVGTLVGATVGAGLGAVIAERHGGRKTWVESGKIGAGAAAGRLAATLAKASIAACVAVVLGVASFA
jgi:uncharacterized protein